MIAQSFNPTAELIIPTGKPINEANAEIETQPLIAEAKQENVMTLKVMMNYFYGKFDQ